MQFTREQWQTLRDELPLPLTEQDLDDLHGQIETVSLKEIADIYLPLSRLLSFYVTARQNLHHASYKFLDHSEAKVPFVIGVSGSVAVGKSTTSRVLKALLAHWPEHPKVEVVTTDGYLLPNEQLEQQGIMHRKGFPESYRVDELSKFLAQLKSGVRDLQVPVYSHQTYDVDPVNVQIVDQPDILILEGVNILQTGMLTKESSVYVSDYLDFSIFVDANADLIFAWFLERFMHFRQLAEKKPDDFFYQFTKLNHEEATKFAIKVWQEVNQLNLEENILPYKYRANCILCKGADHLVEQVLLRRI